MFDGRPGDPAVAGTVRETSTPLRVYVTLRAGCGSRSGLPGSEPFPHPWVDCHSRFRLIPHIAVCATAPQPLQVSLMPSSRGKTFALIETLRSK